MVKEEIDSSQFQRNGFTVNVTVEEIERNLYTGTWNGYGVSIEVKDSVSNDTYEYRDTITKSKLNTSKLKIKILEFLGKNPTTSISEFIELSVKKALDNAREEIGVDSVEEEVRVKMEALEAH